MKWMPKRRDPNRSAKPTREAFFRWSKEIETGIRVIDRDHRALIEVVNRLHENMVDGRFQTALPGLMSNLFDYCSDHFFREEKIMEEYGYPDLRRHQERHRGIRRFVYALRVVAGEHPSSIDPEKMLLFLRDWLTNHIGKSDMDYVQHIRKQMEDTGTAEKQDMFRYSLPAEDVTVELRLPPGDVVLIQQVAEICRGRRHDTMEVEKTVQEILNRNTFNLPLEDCKALVQDLLR